MSNFARVACRTCTTAFPKFAVGLLPAGFCWQYASAAHSFAGLGQPSLRPGSIAALSTVGRPPRRVSDGDAPSGGRERGMGAVAVFALFGLEVEDRVVLRSDCYSALSVRLLSGTSFFTCSNVKRWPPPGVVGR